VDPESLTGLTCLGEVERLGKNGKVLTPVMRFTFPEQEIGAFNGEDQVIFTTREGSVGYSSIKRLDVHAGEVDLLWSAKTAELGCLPPVIIRNGGVSPKPKPTALSELATCVLAGQTLNPVALALLRRDLPVFLPGGGPASGLFNDDLDEMLGWATQLDGSFVSVQGPPGTGKTFRGAHLVRALLKAGKRVGITAMSHHAIDNFLEAVVEVFEDAHDLQELRAVKKGKTDSLGSRTERSDLRPKQSGGIQGPIQPGGGYDMAVRRQRHAR